MLLVRRRHRIAWGNTRAALHLSSGGRRSLQLVLVWRLWMALRRWRWLRVRVLLRVLLTLLLLLLQLLLLQLLLLL